jgi:hypothetical protein
MFDKNELAQLERVVGKVVQEQVPVIVREEMSSAMEHQIIPQFDLLHERIDRIDRKMNTQIASKGWVEDRLDRFSADHRLQYKPAL